MAEMLRFLVEILTYMYDVQLSISLGLTMSIAFYSVWISEYK